MNYEFYLDKLVKTWRRDWYIVNADTHEEAKQKFLNAVKEALDANELIEDSDDLYVTDTEYDIHYVPDEYVKKSEEDPVTTMVGNDRELIYSDDDSK